MTDFIRPYSPDWKTEFERLKIILERELKNFEIDIQHVGSTSIPGLYAKPILDIDIVITDKKLLNDITEKLEKLGYISRGNQGISGRFAFRQTSELTPSTSDTKKWQEHHLYVCYADSLALKNHLLFRNLLMQDQNLIHEYSQLKINLTKQTGMTREKYAKQKTEFILGILALNGLTQDELDQIKDANK